MFNDFFIVETAISSFNNSALFSPYFFVIGLLSVPLFYFAYVFGRDILARLNWNNNTESKIGFWSVATLTLWLTLFGGNYAVIRDGISLLPIAIAIVLFVSMIYITKQAIKLNYLTVFKDKKSKWFAFLTLIILSVFSAKPDLYYILLQLSAVLCGIIVGSRLHKNISDMFMSTLIFGTMMTFILMQPEFFRFGQLGHLTVIHLTALLTTGFFAITTLCAKYTKARAKIHESAYIKLKWFFRISAALALVLFALTESVPVFIGLLGALALSEILTIYHSKTGSENIVKQSWALMLVCFGIIIMCPVISCLGVIYMSESSSKVKGKDFLRLL